MGLILWSVLFLAVHHHSALLSFAFACDIVQSLADCVGQGIKVQHESDRAKMTIKQVLEQRRLNDATGALVKEFFSSVSPEEVLVRLQFRTAPNATSEAGQQAQGSQETDSDLSI